MPTPETTAPDNVERDWDAAAFRTAVQDVLDGFLDEQAQCLADLGPDAARLLAEARTALSGGKRFRAAFCWWGHRAIRPDVEDETALLKACAALELLQASALAHDDLMDASDTRRGHPAAHKALEAEHLASGWPGDAVQYGAAAAILLGDLLLAWADELLRRCGLPMERVVRALAFFDLCRSEVIAGQFLDVSVQARGRADVETAMTVLRFKSAKYSVERPLHIGAALAGASDDDIAALSDFGLPLGEAFQLRDDLLGVYGDPSTTGKPAGDDLVEGKRTVLVAIALGRAEEPEASELDSSLGTDLDEAQVERLRDLISRTGADDEVEAMIGTLTRKADAALDRAGLDPRATAVLHSLAEAVTQRTV